MRYEHIVRAVFGEPWAILPEVHAVILDVVRFRASGGMLTDEEIASRIEAAGPARRQSPSGPQSVAVLPLMGVLAHRMNLMSAMSGGTSLELFGQSFDAAVSDSQISAVVIDVDSPGGEVAGVTEMAARVQAARAEKPIVAVANSMAASAAYWIASAATEVVVTPSGQVGSLGVIAAHEDISALQEREGVKTTLVSAGKYKTEGHPFGPLEDDARAEAQSRVDAVFGVFLKDVARGRGVPVSEVRSGFGEGRMVLAQQAVKLGMADRVATLGETVQRLAGKRRGGAKRDDMAARGRLMGIRS